MELGGWGPDQGYASQDFISRKKKVETMESESEIENLWYINALLWLRDKLSWKK